MDFDFDKVDRLHEALYRTLVAVEAKEAVNLAEAMTAAMRLLSTVMAAYEHKTHGGAPERDRDAEIEAYCRDAAFMAKTHLNAIVNAYEYFKRTEGVE